MSSYNACNVITIGEDATRLVSRVEYDSETDKLVGFVLPIDNNDLPLSVSFMAVSFRHIEESFEVGKVAKHAFVYMAQSLIVGVPAFCLACLGTDNKFTANLVLQRWKYILSECTKHGILIVSFGADGDSRELSAMQKSVQLLCKSPSLESLILPLNSLSVSSYWSSWFISKKPTVVAFV